MSDLEKPSNQNPKKDTKQGEWAELENDSRFKENLLSRLQMRLIFKKLGGEDFYDEYHTLSIRKASEDSTGEIKKPESLADQADMLDRLETDPLIPEIHAFENRVMNTETVDEVLALAKSEGLEFTLKEVSEAKGEAIQMMEFEED